MQAPEKNYASFYCFTGGQSKPPMDKSWASSCLPVHREYKNLYSISIHEGVSKLQTFVYVAVMKEFTNDSFSVNFPSFLNTEACLGQKLYLGDAQIHGKHNEQIFVSICYCISKL